MGEVIVVTSGKGGAVRDRRKLFPERSRQERGEDPGGFGEDSGEKRTDQRTLRTAVCGEGYGGGSWGEKKIKGAGDRYSEN